MELHKFSVPIGDNFHNYNGGYAVLVSESNTGITNTKRWQDYLLYRGACSFCPVRTPCQMQMDMAPAVELSLYADVSDNKRIRPVVIGMAEQILGKSCLLNNVYVAVDP